MPVLVFVEDSRVDAGADVLASRQQGRARGRADGRPGIEIGEPHAAGREAIDRRRLHRAAIAAEVFVAQIVGEQDDDIGALFG